MGEGLKRCCTCKDEKSLSDFHRSARTKDGLQARCISCSRDKERARYRSNPTLYRDKAKAARTPDRMKSNNLARYWPDLKPKERLALYRAKIVEQGGLCAICKTPPMHPLQVDHSHATGAVRKLLCSPCNRVLGLLKDEVVTARSVVVYLEEHHGLR